MFVKSEWNPSRKNLFQKLFKKGLTIALNLSIILMLPCESGGTGRRARLRGVWFTPYGFKSRFSHQQRRRVPKWAPFFFVFRCRNGLAAAGMLRCFAMFGGGGQSLAVFAKQNDGVQPSSQAPVFRLALKPKSSPVSRTNLCCLNRCRQRNPRSQAASGVFSCYFSE